MLSIQQLSIEKGRAVLDLNQFFYPPKTLKETAKAFGGACRANIKHVGERFRVEIIPLKGNPLEETALEFCNYALSLSKEMR